MNARSVEHRLGTIAVGLSTAVVLIAIAILPFLTPAWVAFEQGRSGAAELTGFSPSELRTATNAILADLVLGPPDFDVRGEKSAQPILTAPERAHMRDVRGVFGSFYLVAGLATLILVITARMTGPRTATWSRRDAWRAVRLGSLGLAGGIAIAGVIAATAFDAAFEVFHRLFFAQGTYLFDPQTSRLIQLFPDAFWSETSIAVGAVILVLALGTAWLAGQRLRAGQSARLLSSEPPAPPRPGGPAPATAARDPEAAR